MHVPQGTEPNKIQDDDFTESKKMDTGSFSEGHYIPSFIPQWNLWGFRPHRTPSSMSMNISKEGYECNKNINANDIHNLPLINRIMEHLEYIIKK